MNPIEERLKYIKNRSIYYKEPGPHYVPRDTVLLEDYDFAWLLDTIEKQGMRINKLEELLDTDFNSNISSK